MIALTVHIKEYIEQHFSEKLCAEDLAKAFNVSSSTLRRQFQLCYRTSLHQYILQVRMEKGKMLLRSARYTIAEVGRMVGFNEPSNFARAYVKYYGVPPSESLGGFKRRGAR